jgi:hypothetical protein
MSGTIARGASPLSLFDRQMRLSGSTIRTVPAACINTVAMVSTPTLRGRGFDALRTEEAGKDTASDEQQLIFAAAERRAIVT